jgi:hypothetical protein
MRWIISRTVFLAGLFCATAASAADVTAICKLADDKRTVTVAFTNPTPRTLQCEVNCDMAVPNGFGTVVCAKKVPGSATDLVMCTQVKESGTYSRVKGQEINCFDPEGTPVPAPAADSGKDDDDDQKADEMMQKMMKQGQEFLEQQKKLHPQN